MYENICLRCNEGAAGKEAVQPTIDIPSIYVGETSRSLQERGMEHWRAARGKKETSHMRIHQEQQHGGEEPSFILKPVSFHRTALSRQLSEAVRIRRRGGEGAILNSKAEFSRCHIPRLQVEPDLEKEQREKREQEAWEQLEKETEEDLNEWEANKVRSRKEQILASLGTKRKGDIKRDREEQVKKH